MSLKIYHSETVFQLLRRVLEVYTAKQISMIRQFTNYLIQAFAVLLIISVTVPQSLSAQSNVAFMSSATDYSDVQPDPYRSEFFKVDGHPNITVNTLAGDIEVVENPGIDGVQIDLFVKREFSLWSGTRSLDNYRIIMQKQGNSIIASVEDRRSGRDLRSSESVEFNFQVQVPSEASLNLRSMQGEILAKGVEGKHFIQNHAGDLTIQDLSGEVRAASTSGNIFLSNLQGNIYVKTVSGDIRSDQDRGEIRLRTTTGDIVTSGLSGTLVAGSTSGDIISEFREVSVGIYLETTTGDIDLMIPSGKGYSISAKGMDFNFDDFADDSNSKDIGFMNASLEVGDGDIPVNLKSVSGSVKVRENQ